MEEMEWNRMKWRGKKDGMEMKWNECDGIKGMEWKGLGRIV